MHHGVYCVVAIRSSDSISAYDKKPVTRVLLRCRELSDIVDCASVTRTTSFISDEAVLARNAVGQLSITTVQCYAAALSGRQSFKHNARRAAAAAADRIFHQSNCVTSSLLLRARAAQRLTQVEFVGDFASR